MPADPSCLRKRRLGRTHPGRRRPAGVRMEVRARSAAWPSSWRRACIAARSGSCSSPTTSRSGRRSDSTSARSCRTCSDRAHSRARPPREAYFVKCDRETTTQNDINLGIVNIVVGFAPLKPAEFVVIKTAANRGRYRDLSAPEPHRSLQESSHGTVFSQRSTLRPLQELQVSREVGWALRGGHQQGVGAEAQHGGGRTPRGRRSLDRAASRPAARSTKPSPWTGA